MFLATTTATTCFVLIFCYQNDIQVLFCQIPIAFVCCAVLPATARCEYIILHGAHLSIPLCRICARFAQKQNKNGSEIYYRFLQNLFVYSLPSKSCCCCLYRSLLWSKALVCTICCCKVAVSLYLLATTMPTTMMAMGSNVNAMRIANCAPSC